MGDRAGTKKWGVRYPWREWFSAKHGFTLKRGVDFKGMTHGMAAMIRNRASKEGIGIHLRIVDDNTIEVRYK